MAVLGRLLISSAERLDLPDILSMDSYAAGDWKYFLKGIVGTSKPYILKGFDIISPENAIGTQSCSIRIADSVVFFPESNAGPFFHGLEEGHAQAQPLVPELRKNAVNYVYLTFSTFNTSVDTRAFWDPDKDGGEGGEFTQDVNTESVISVDVNVSTSSFPANTIPVAKITVGPVVITAIEDARDQLFRLGNGGISPNPFNRYSFRSLPGSSYKRTEPSTSLTSASDPNPFQGGDKNIYSLKEWMDAAMTKLLELGGTNYWYEDISTFNLINLFNDALATTIQSKGAWSHDSATEGLISWSEDIQIKNIIDKRDIILRAGSKVLDNDQVMFIRLVRNSPINFGDVNVTWTSGVNCVNGTTNSFQYLSKGDWVKKCNDPNNYYLRVEEFYAGTNLSGGTTTATLAKSIKLSANYPGDSGSKKAVYTKGVYETSEIQVEDRASAAIDMVGGNLHWLAARSDIVTNISNIVTTSLTGNISESNSTTAKFTANAAHGLQDGDRVTITGAGSYNGTYVVEVEDATSFYINTSATSNPSSVAAYYAVVTSSSRSTDNGLQLESSTHGLETGNYVKISGTANYDGVYVVSKRSSTEYSIAVSSAPASESSGTSTLARIDVRSESGIERVVRGEIKEISGSVTDALMQYIGMPSETQFTPVYAVPSSYSAINGYQNYNSSDMDSLTARVSKLTAMMADRVQDRDMKLVGRVSIKNTTSGSNQDISASGTLRLEKPGSLPQTINLACSLPTNSAAVMYVDRNGGSNISLQVKALGTPYLLEENAIILFYRLSTTNVYAWDGATIAKNGSYTPFNPEDAQSKNIFIYNAGRLKLDNVSGEVTFLDPNYDPTIMIPGSSASNIIDASAINTLGTFVMDDGDCAWIRIDRNISKTFNIVQTSDTVDSNANGALYVTPISSVPVDQDVIVFATRVGNMLIQSKMGIAPSTNVYEESLKVVSGIPLDDNEITGPVAVGQTLMLPSDSRDGDSDQEYVVGASLLEVYLNGQLLKQGDDWLEIGSVGVLSKYININQNLEIGDVLLFRIDTQGGVFIADNSGGTPDSLQSAYNTGRFVTVASGQPIVITGPAGQKLIQINGDMDVGGVIDPKGITFIPLSSDPLDSTDNGLWVNSSGELIHKRGNTAAPINVTDILSNLSSGTFNVPAITDSVDNNSGSILAKLTPVKITASGDIDKIDVSVEADALAIAGILNSDTADGEVGEIVSSGRIRDVDTSADLGDIIYIAKNGLTTNIKPSEGVAGFVASDYVIRLGVVAKNTANPLKKDLLVNIQIIGQL